MPPKRAATKRQYSAIDIDSDADSSASESASRAAPKRKAPAKKTTTKPTPGKKATATKGPTVAKTYKDAIKALETALKSLDAKVRKMPPNSRTITTDTYADMASKHLKAYGQLQRQKLAWENERREEKRERRESVDDWVTVAIQDLKEERDCLAEYGVEKYFPNSIARLEELLVSETDAAAGAGDVA
ncbi:hypothetical protein D6D19_03596 [Aureobasidium pullulans]|uniref:Uncharacterized protein n=1 Tax=Aureobasidium pullulans TaxID=5580 RepID=A0A4S9LJF3_AURPU|nr:hypothetical protein D6D19_03596 [Aureobasidium pullulans]THY29508.1 hypothetical protein D6D00_03487 [Aureobasidium pullulans]